MEEIANNIFWNPALHFHEQSDEAQAMAYEAVTHPVVRVEFENCDSGNQRVLFKEFDLGSNHTIKITYNYNNTPDSTEWAGIKNRLITVYGK